MTDRPDVLYPTIVDGVVAGDTLRLECLDGGSLMIDKSNDLLLSGACRWQDGAFRLKDFGPIEIDGKMWGVTHLQKQSARGYLKADPDCFHWWGFWKPQEKDDQGNWIPGTEQGIYVRKSRTLFKLTCWRWDVAGTMIGETMRHWIKSGGYFGLHWD